MIPGGSIQQQPVVVNGAGGSFLGAGNSGSAFTLDIANGGEGSSSVQNGLHHVSHQGTGASTQKAVALDAAAAASADQLEEMRREIAELEAQMNRGAAPRPTTLAHGSMDLSGYGPTAQVLLCGGAVLTLYLLFGILQEWLLKHAFRPPESSVREVARSAGWFVSLLQFGCYASFETMQREKGAKVLEGRKAPFSAYMMLGMLQVCCLALSNVAVQYLNYPTHVLFKSAKPIPTLLVGALYLQRKYSRLDYGAALMMIFGLVLFVAADEQQHVSTYGFILVSIALVAETYIVSVQDKVMTQYRAPQHEVVLYTHACGAAMLLTACIISGELPHGLATLARHPAVLLAILLFSACGYYGAAALRALVKYRGQFTGLVTTTARKALALVLSVVLFPKRWGAQYTLGALLFLIGTLVSAGPAKMRLRAWLGDTSVGKLLKLDARRSRAERILA